MVSTSDKNSVVWFLLCRVVGMANTETNRPFLLLRYTLIVATAYLILVEDQFALPPVGIVLLIVAVAQLPSSLTQSMSFGVGIILGGTLWITAALLHSGQFNAEFFFLYFF